MKQKFLSAFHTFIVCAFVALTVGAFTACSSDDETPAPPQIPAPQTFSGDLTSSVSAPSQAPVEVTNANTAVLTWLDAEQTKASMKLGAFSISLPQMGGRVIEIGEMTIGDIVCKKNGSKIEMSNDAFDCMAGDYLIEGGKFSGTLENGKLTFTLLYKPGSMPFDVQSVFVSK